MSKSRIVEISPLTRVEGHGKVTIHMDENNAVREARLHIVEFRGFERFIRERLFWEIPVIVQRLCGICPVSHHLASAKAMDQIVGATRLSPTAEKMRRLMHYGQVMQSHVLHFFHLCSPDLLFGFGAPLDKRNIFAVINEFPDLALQAIKMRKYGQEIIEKTAGKKIHGTGAVAGGINKNLSINERDNLLKDIDQMLQWAQGALDLARSYTLDHCDLVKSFGAFPSHYLSLAGENGELDLYHGQLRALDHDGNTIFDHIDYNRYHDLLVEDVRSWSYMKFPYIKKLGKQDGWYRVGPLARMNTASFINTPLANTAHQEFKALNHGQPNPATLMNHWARMIEVVHCVEKIKELLHDSDLQQDDLIVSGQRQEEGVGVIEAPRGTLIHHYKVDKNDQVQFCNLIVSTTHNNEAMNRAITDVARQYISHQPQISEGLLNHIEVAVRAYDPCLSCATHALGQMPLSIELYDCNATLVDKRIKDG